jgi:hypothetical protein
MSTAKLPFDDELTSLVIKKHLRKTHLNQNRRNALESTWPTKMSALVEKNALLYSGHVYVQTNEKVPKTKSKTFVGQSLIRGNTGSGVFTTSNIAMDGVVCYFYGTIKKNHHNPEYAIDIDDNYVVDPILTKTPNRSVTKRTSDHGAYINEPVDQLSKIDSGRSRVQWKTYGADLAKKYRMSKKLNSKQLQRLSKLPLMVNVFISKTESKELVDEALKNGLKTVRLKVRALRSLGKGEQLTLCYGSAYKRDGYTSNNCCLADYDYRQEGGQVLRDGECQEISMKKNGASDSDDSDDSDDDDDEVLIFPKRRKKEVKEANDDSDISDDSDDDDEELLFPPKRQKKQINNKDDDDDDDSESSEDSADDDEVLLFPPKRQKKQINNKDDDDEELLFPRKKEMKESNNDDDDNDDDDNDDDQISTRRKNMVNRILNINLKENTVTFAMSHRRQYVYELNDKVLGSILTPTYFARLVAKFYKDNVGGLRRFVRQKGRELSDEDETKHVSDIIRQFDDGTHQVVWENGHQTRMSHLELDETAVTPIIEEAFDLSYVATPIDVAVAFARYVLENRRLKSMRNDSDEEDYEIESILRQRVLSNGTKEYLVHWKGYRHHTDELIAEENVSAPDVVREFERAHAAKLRRQNVYADKVRQRVRSHTFMRNSFLFGE